MLGPDPLGLVDERALGVLTQNLPLGAQSLRDLGVVHLRVLLRNLPSLHPRPDHEGVHRPLDVVITLPCGGVHHGIVYTRTVDGQTKSGSVERRGIQSNFVKVRRLHDRVVM